MQYYRQTNNSGIENILEEKDYLGLDYLDYLSLAFYFIFHLVRYSSYILNESQNLLCPKTCLLSLVVANNLQPVTTNSETTL